MREVVRGDIVYIPASATRPARLLDVYLPRSSRFDSDDEESEKENLPPTPAIVLLAFPSYRLAGSRSFPVSAIARQLSTHFNVRVVVPALTPFGWDGHDRALERMVGETRACLAWVRRNILRYGGSPEKVYLMGYGAGAHIAAVSPAVRDPGPVSLGFVGRRSLADGSFPELVPFRPCGYTYRS